MSNDSPARELSAAFETHRLDVRRRARLSAATDSLHERCVAVVTSRPYRKEQQRRDLSSVRRNQEILGRTTRGEETECANSANGSRTVLRTVCKSSTTLASSYQCRCRSERETIFQSVSIVRTPRIDLESLNRRSGVWRCPIRR